MNLLLLLGFASLLPIWRVPGRDPYEGVNWWDYVYEWHLGVEHISLEEARKEAYYIYYPEDRSD